MAYVSNINGYDIKDKEALHDPEGLVNDILDKVFKDNVSHVAPRYHQGVFRGTAKCSGMAIDGDTLYVVGDYLGAYGNEGVLYRFSISNNTKIDERYPETGHANSMCFNYSDNHLYVAPCWEYGTEYTQYNCFFLYKINPTNLALTKLDFKNDIKNVTTENGDLNGVSYDSVTDTLYFEFKTVSNKVYIFKVVNDGAVLVKDLSNVVKIYDDSVAQGLAVNNDIVYLPNIVGSVQSVSLKDGTTTFFHMSHVDTDIKYNLGEFEDLEFNSDGLMYSVSFMNIGEDDSKPMFITHITSTPLGDQCITNVNYHNTIKRNFYISDETKGRLKCDYYALPWLECVSSLCVPSINVTISVNGELDTYRPIVFPNNTYIQVNANSTLKISQLIFKACGAIRVNGVLDCYNAKDYQGVIFLYGNGDMKITTQGNGCMKNLPPSYFVKGSAGNALICFGYLARTEGGATQYTIDTFPKPNNSVNIGAWTCQMRTDV